MLKLVILAASFVAGQTDLAELAAADLAKVPADARASVRYLEQAELPEAERGLAVKILSGHVNGLSRETDMTPVYVVPGSGFALLRVNLDDYGWSRDVYEQLANQDPYDHVTITAVAEAAVLLPLVWRTFADNPGQVFLYDGGNMVGGYDRAAKQFRPFALGQWGKSAAPPIPFEPGPALAGGKQRVLTDRLGKRVLTLAAATGSQVPILKASWFFNQTAAQEGRAPGYYDFLGVKKEADFQALIGFDGKRQRRKVELREAVTNSGVATSGARGIVRETAEDGGYWRTLDFRKPVDRLNPLRVLGRDLDDEFKAASVDDVATEQFGPLANGLWAWFLGNNQGVRQAVAPDFAAADKLTKSNDHRIHVNASCMRCHVPGGVHDISPWVRNLIQPPLALQSPDYKRLRELRQQYLRRLTPFMDRDRQAFAAAVFEATGLDVKLYQAGYAAYWSRYEDAKVDAAWAARDLGIDTKVFKAALAAYLKQTGNIDPVLGVFLLDGPRRQTVGIRQWEEIFPLARQLLKGIKP